jgi:hypothetical protein
MSMKRVITLAAVLVLCLSLLTVCSGPTDRERVLDLVKNLTQLAEERETVRILGQLDEDYTDFEGRSKDATREMLDEYFAHYRGIVINVLRSRIDELDTGQAVAQADLAFSSGAAKVFRKLARISMDNYRLKIRLRKSGERWLVTYAEWRPLGAGELLSGPE